MNVKPVIVIFFSLLNLFFITACFAQEQGHAEDDCDFNDQMNVIRSKKQAVADSIELLNFIPAIPIGTETCATPANASAELTFDVQKDKIFGFYNGVKNANIYLVILSRAGSIIQAPVNGIRYKKGEYIDKGLIVGDNDATAFVALHLTPLTQYRIDIYAGNANCAEGIKYNPVPVFSGQKTTAATNEYNHYFGNLHSHSGYSDGNKENTATTPAEDYAFAKDAECMDFLGIAEHNHFSYPDNPGMLLSDYHLGVQQANTFTSTHPGFLALYGMEYGVISNGGHVVVYGIDSLLGWETLSGSHNYDIYVGKYDYSGTNGLFQTINRFKSTKAFATLAHPEDNDYGNLLNTAYRVIADSAIVGSTLENGPAFSDEVNYNDYPSTMSYLQYYKGLLAKGYHVGPTIDHDNHYLTFGKTARSRLVVLSQSLNKDDFMGAMRSRSFYATHSCTAMLDFKVSGADMGTVMQHANVPDIVVSIEDASTNQQPSIRIYKGTDDGNVASIITTQSGNTLTYTDNDLVDGESAYYFADIKTGNLRTISSPVWYHRNDQATTSVSQISSPGKKNQIRILENPVTSQVLRYQLTGEGHSLQGTIQITDIYGRQLYNAQIVTDTKVKSIEVSAFPAGTYLLQVLSDEGRLYAKFVKY